MSGAVVRTLRRFVDALQRGLFDDPVADADPVGREPPRARAPVAPDLLRHPRATRSIVLDGQAVHYLLKRTRRRTIGFVVGGEGLTVSAPKWVALRDIDAALRERARWILAKLVEQRERAARIEATRTVWQDGATFAYLGRPITIALDRRHGLAAGEVELDAEASAPAERALHVGLPRDASEERVRDAVQSWLQREARRVFTARVAHFAERLDVRVTRLALSSAQTRWGSANASGAIRLHWRLVQYALPTIDYVVAHELAHLREMNHSARFWNIVRSVVPEFEDARRELRDASTAEPIA
ncbi:MAG: SprT family zinc-dependent metalloprotease [Caldimonas sp.]